MKLQLTAEQLEHMVKLYLTRVLHIEDWEAGHIVMTDDSGEELDDIECYGVLIHLEQKVPPDNVHKADCRWSPDTNDLCTCSVLP